LSDIVGLDLTIDVGENLYAAVPDDEWREVFKPADFVLEMVRRGWRGEKSGQGFYRRVRGAQGSEILTLDLDAWEYRPRERVRFESVGAAREIQDPAERLRALVNGSDRAAQYAWKVLSETLVYAAARAGRPPAEGRARLRERGRDEPGRQPARPGRRRPLPGVPREGQRDGPRGPGDDRPRRPRGGAELGGAGGRQPGPDVLGGREPG